MLKEKLCQTKWEKLNRCFELIYQWERNEEIISQIGNYLRQINQDRSVSDVELRARP